MKALAAALAAGICAISVAQTHVVPAHIDKHGKWIPAHEVKDRKQSNTPKTINKGLVDGYKTPKKPRNSPETRPGLHKEHRYYPGHTGKDGHYIKPHWQWVWVKG